MTGGYVAFWPELNWWGEGRGGSGSLLIKPPEMDRMLRGIQSFPPSHSQSFPWHLQADKHGSISLLFHFFQRLICKKAAFTWTIWWLVTKKNNAYFANMANKCHQHTSSKYDWSPCLKQVSIIIQKCSFNKKSEMNCKWLDAVTVKLCTRHCKKSWLTVFFFGQRKAWHSRVSLCWLWTM